MNKKQTKNKYFATNICMRFKRKTKNKKNTKKKKKKVYINIII